MDGLKLPIHFFTDFIHSFPPLFIKILSLSTHFQLILNQSYLQRSSFGIKILQTFNSCLTHFFANFIHSFPPLLIKIIPLSTYSQLILNQSHSQLLFIFLPNCYFIYFILNSFAPLGYKFSRFFYSNRTNFMSSIAHYLVYPSQMLPLSTPQILDSF